jgi:hypothetical protein
MNIKSKKQLNTKLTCEAIAKLAASTDKPSLMSHIAEAQLINSIGADNFGAR